MVRRLQVLPDQSVVVDLAVDGEDNALIGIGEWLSSALYFLVRIRLRGEIYGSRPTNTDDTEPFMAKYCSVVLVHPSVRFLGEINGPIQVPKCVSYSCC